MGSFFDRFRDLDSLREQAEDLLQDGLRQTRRQTAIARLRMRIYELERRMTNEFRHLGEQVWELHSDGNLRPESLSGAFQVLEALADEIEASKEELQDLFEAARRGDDEEVPEPAAATPPPPPPPPPDLTDPADRLIEDEPSGPAGGEQSQ